MPQDFEQMILLVTLAMFNGGVIFFQRIFGQSLGRDILSGGDDRDDHDTLASGPMQRNQNALALPTSLGRRGKHVDCLSWNSIARVKLYDAMSSFGIPAIQLQPNYSKGSLNKTLSCVQ